MDLVVLDFESFYSREFSLSKLTTEEYIRDPQFEVIGVCAKHNDGPVEWVTGDHWTIQHYLDSLELQDKAVLAHNCVTGDHEVRTPGGWVRFDALEDGTPVAQWDPDTGDISFVVPSAVVRKVYSGEMIAWDTNFHKGVYTPDHRMYVSTPNSAWAAVTAGEVATRSPNNNYVPTAGVLQANTAGNAWLTPAVARIMEMLRADASLSKTTKTAKLHLSKARKVARATALLDAVGWRYSVSTTKAGNTSIYVNSQPGLEPIHDLLMSSGQKQYGPWLLTLPVPAREAILDEIQYWDGHLPKPPVKGTKSKYATTVATAVREDAYWLAELAIMTGRAAKVVYDTPNTRGFSRPDSVLHYVFIRPRTRAKLVERPTHRQFSGMVYCVSVPTGAFLVRREGVTWVTGNCMFDGAILSWKFGIRPKLLLDTLSMSRAWHGVDRRHSLAALAKQYGLPDKGTEVQNAMGLRRVDFGDEQMAAYGEYCKHDVDLCLSIFNSMISAGFPKRELQLIDKTLRMFTEPRLKLDLELLEGHLIATQRRKQELLDAAGVADKKDLMSNAKFAGLLEKLGVDPPMKVSPTTGKLTYAFAKTDPAMKELEEHENPHVQTLVAARLGNKSTLEETRTERFMAIAGRGKLPIPLRYYAAHTGRWGGSDKINLQNLPSRGPNAKKLKKAIRAPEGHMLIDCDSSQIEARVLAWLAGQDDLVQVFENNNAEILAGVPKAEHQYDPYRTMASKIYGTPPDQIDGAGRQIGKVVLLGSGYGAGHKTLQGFLKMQAGVEVSLDEAKRIVDVYRHSNSRIADLWKEAHTALRGMIHGDKYALGIPGVVEVDPAVPGIKMPSGLTIQYKGLYAEQGERGLEFFYPTRRGPARQYGPKCVENVTQGLARCVVGEQLLKIAKRYRVVLTVHDSIVSCVPEDEVDEAREYIEQCMRTPPKWAAGLPVNCESEIGESYGG